MVQQINTVCDAAEQNKMLLTELLNRYTLSRRIKGSNPSVSARDL
jgi:hypothetical protein